LGFFSAQVASGRLWLELMSVYSVGLMAFGVGLQVHLGSIMCADHDDLDEEVADPGAEGLGGDARALEVSYEAAAGTVRCAAPPREFTTLLCGASMVTFLAQQLILPQHEGLDEYLGHFVDHAKVFPHDILVCIVSCKCATVLGTLFLALFPGNLRALEILLIVLFITLAQGLIQAVENMVVHVSRTVHGVEDAKASPKYRRAFLRGKQLFLEGRQMVINQFKDRWKNENHQGSEQEKAEAEQERPTEPAMRAGRAAEAVEADAKQEHLSR